MFSIKTPSIYFLIIVLLAGTAGVQASPTQTQQNERKMVITIDDLPSVGAKTLQDKQHITDALLASFKNYGVPAIGFVNEKKLGKTAPKPHNIALLKQWVDAGMELGNHTYSHPKFYDTPLEDYKQEVITGERVTKTLFTPETHKPRYFRHPYLNTGPELATRLEFERFLSQHNYRVAPVTIDNSEWIYSKAYNKAKAANDSALMQKIGNDYVQYICLLYTSPSPRDA